MIGEMLEMVVDAHRVVTTAFSLEMELIFVGHVLGASQLEAEKVCVPYFQVGKRSLELFHVSGTQVGADAGDEKILLQDELEKLMELRLCCTGFLRYRRHLQEGEKCMFINKI